MLTDYSTDSNFVPGYSGPQNSYLKVGIVVSIVLHAFLFSFLNSPLTRHTALPHIFEVSYELPEIKRKQITSTPDIPSTEPNPSARFLSDRDAKTENEQLKRGDNPLAGKIKRSPSVQSSRLNASAATKKNPVSKAEPENLSTGSRKLKLLKLDSKSIARRFGSPDARRRSAAPHRNAARGISLQDYSAFSRAKGSGARIIGVPGVSDYIPGLPDGDITLLNTKASKFAVFVRRVAVRVFGEIRLAGWDHLLAGDIAKINDFSTVKATLSPDGRLLNATLITSSGSIRFDETLLSAAKRGAFDKNPPRGAVSDDGNIHFLFKSRSWTRTVAGANGALTERRWLLLGTGLE